MMQVDKDMRIVSANILDTSPDDPINHQLLEAIKDWKVTIDGELTPFTTGVRVKPEMIKEK